MNNRFILIIALASLVVLLINACASNPAASPQPATEQPGTEPPMPTQTTPPQPTSTPEPSLPAPLEKTIYVGPALVDCQGVAPQKCLQVKENPADEYTLFYSQIEGFAYEEGNEYELIVREDKIENPPADAPNFKWTLVEIVSQTPVVATVTPETSLSLEGQIFTLDWYLSASGEQVQVLPDTEITAEVKEGRIGGSSGCNSYSASFEVEGSEVKIGPIVSTLMACPDPVMEQERVYLEALQKADSYNLSDGTLTFIDDEGNTILSYIVAEPLSLVGTYWEAISYNTGKDSVSTLISGTKITAFFDEEGNLSGTAGCNNYNATYTVDGNSISIGPAASTRMFCGEPEGVMDQETAYLMSLEKASTYEIKGDTLSIFAADGSRLADYQANPLIGKTWSLAEIQYMDGTVKTSDDPAKYTLEFLPDGTLNIQADCNVVGGEYTVSGPSLSISTNLSTLAACPPDSLSEEFLENLRIAATFQFEGDDLYIATQMDVAIMKFTPMP